MCRFEWRTFFYISTSVHWESSSFWHANRLLSVQMQALALSRHHKWTEMINLACKTPGVKLLYGNIVSSYSEILWNRLHDRSVGGKGTKSWVWSRMSTTVVVVCWELHFCCSTSTLAGIHPPLSDATTRPKETTRTSRVTLMFSNFELQSLLRRLQICDDPDCQIKV